MFRIAAVSSDPELIDKFFQGAVEKKYKLAFPDTTYEVSIVLHDGKPFNITDQKKYHGIFVLTSSTSDSLLSTYLDQVTPENRKSNRRVCVEHLKPGDSLENKLYSMVSYLTLEFWQRSKQKMHLLVF